MAFRCGMLTNRMPRYEYFKSEPGQFYCIAARIRELVHPAAFTHMGQKFLSLSMHQLHRQRRRTRPSQSGLSESPRRQELASYQGIAQFHGWREEGKIG